MNANSACCFENWAGEHCAHVDTPVRPRTFVGRWIAARRMAKMVAQWDAEQAARAAVECDW